MKDRFFRARGITCNSKSVRPGFIFVALKGSRLDGRKFIKEALDRGASLVVFQGISAGLKRYKQAPLLRVENSRRFLSAASAELYGHPSRKMKVVGITGTNGKTTITYLLEALLKEAGSGCGVIGTVNYRYKNKQLPAGNTTPGPAELQMLLSDMCRKKVQYCVMEVSSHALHQGRVEDLYFDSAIFTNLSRDHLDYHKTTDNYFRAKSALFRGLSPGCFAVINNDDAYSQRLKNITSAAVITYAIKKKADVTARQISYGLDATRFKLIAPGIRTDIKTPLLGRYNVYNILAACAWALKEGMGIGTIKRALDKFSCVPGRLEMIDTQAGFKVFVDYAHTPDALYNVLSCLRPLIEGRIILVFGCGGERDRGKRAQMARVASSLADFTVITSDNPRSEEPMRIIGQIKNGMRGKNYRLVKERQAAIRLALKMAKEKDAVLVAGKGHEVYQIIKNRAIPFDDRVVIKKCLKSLSL